MIIAEVYCKSYDLVVQGAGSAYPSPRLSLATTATVPIRSHHTLDGVSILDGEERKQAEEEPLHESDYQQLLLDYIEVHGRSNFVLKYAITKEVKSTGMLDSWRGF
jgi:hypothetical protein